jgi:hypothetical protein
MRGHLGITIILSGLAACATATVPDQFREDPLHESTGPLSNVISATELRAVNVGDLFQAVTRLRPAFFTRMREVPSPIFGSNRLDVYLDNVYLGDISTLRTISPDAVTYVRYLSSSEATIRWGDKHRGDVILISTR